MTARGESVRADDNPDVLKGRLAAYRAQTAPLAGYYAGKGLLKSVDGMAPIDEVTAAIGQHLGAAASAKPAARARAKSGRRNKAKAPKGSRRRTLKARQRRKRPAAAARRGKKRPGLRKNRRRRLTKAR
jgi:adenylate kinase